MDVKELRIGSKIGYYQPDKKDMTIDELKSIYFDDDINDYRIELKSGNYDLCHLPLSGIVPIPLTEDILLKCGFEKEEISLRTWSTVFYQGEECSLIVDKGDFYLGDYYEGYEGGYEHYFFDNKIEYIHQLQNLYFCVCGKELEIKLD